MSSRFRLLGLAAALSCAATASQAATPFIYAITVTTNASSTFTDCFTFYEGTLTIAGLTGVVLPYTATPGTPKTSYVAVSSPSNAIDFNLAFTGSKTGNATSGTITAIGGDNEHDSYRVTGVAVPACPPMTDAARTGRATWFHKN